MSIMEELIFFFELQIKQMKEEIFITQSKYTGELLKKFRIESSKSVSTPITPSCKLDKDKHGKSVDSKFYRGMIGSLLYLIANRPDIMFSICMYAKFQSNPKESYLNAVKIFKYLKETQNPGLWFSKQSSIELIGYSDTDFAGYRLDRKSTSETCQFLKVNLISWFRKKQNLMALSIAEVEYITVESCCT